MLMLLLCVSSPSFDNELALYEREALELRMRPLDYGHELKRRGVKIALGPFAQGAEKIFVRVPETLADVARYRLFKGAGIAGVVLGLGLLTLSSVAVAIAAIEGKPLDVPLFVAPLVIGLDVAGVGIGLLIFAPTYLQRAVAIYNESVMAQALR